VTGEEPPSVEASLNDIYAAISGVVVELEALVAIERAYARRELGRDPLVGTAYTEVEDAMLVPPPWVSRGGKEDDEE
jgi:hypothetical protein